MIRSFRDRDTERLFRRERVKRFEAFARIAYRKLVALDTVERVEHLAIPPGNRLEALKGDRSGEWSIRINDQYRICFKWRDGDAYDVQVVDYHR
jgi:proteic killer suppression protein